MQHTSLATTFAVATLVLAPGISGRGLRAAELAPRPAMNVVDDVDSSSSAADSTVSDADTSAGRWQFGGRVALMMRLSDIGPVVDTERRVVSASLTWSRFRGKIAPLGITSELGIMVISASDSMAAIPYGSFGPVLRFGGFSLDCQVGMLLVIPYVSPSASFAVPLGTSVDLTLRTAGFVGLAGGTNPDVVIGAALGFH